MEQQLINAFMKLVAKAGGGSLIKDLIREVDENRNPKIWTPTEIEKAIAYVTEQTESFGAADAIVIIETLMQKYNLRTESFLPAHESLPGTAGIQGLQ
ncbi:hypothetical protein KK083_29200 [Fulvivirgaceae bacterium PWU4]|uniref:Uncharacterized protein n=1 Tax=Chryseosolibacter histidini TaxID=2782349 RepID=A0AAP2DR78_9BACT|nr:hypothetical protein [Chryseosolibacter histidini]MBT1701006.1 hypothetical protein [Chryseosolibacter histidini]